MHTDRETYDRIIAELGDGVPGVVQYQQLAGLHLTISGSSLQHLDPFSDDYRMVVMDLYQRLRGSADKDYQPARDEHAPAPLPANLFTSVVPWSFRDPALVAEFLHCWGHILRLIAPLQGQALRVLEYGPGSGQILLMLARLGIEVYGVDINADAVAGIRAQADLMGVGVNVEQAEFGEGFEGQTFDRILFFEAFHHAIDFMPLLRRLHDRLAPGGRLILCGEPIVHQPSPGIPNPWGPRLDGLSAFCIRRFGWMELGFHASFMFEAMRRAGWLMKSRPFPGCARADAWVAEPVLILTPGDVWTIQCGSSEADDLLIGTGWSVPEITHRWTIGADARVILPDAEQGALHLDVSLQNLLSIEQPVTISCGERITEISIPPHAMQQVLLSDCTGATLLISCPTHRAADLLPASIDTRQLGIGVIGVRAEASAKQS